MEPIDQAFNDWLEKKQILNEGMQTNRYSVEVNYRTCMDEVSDQFAKLVIGYVSAGMKNCGYHCKISFKDKPFRVMVSSRNWDDGEWVGVATFDKDKFVIARGTYNKERKSVSIHSSKKCRGTSAAEIVRELRNLMEELKRATGVDDKLEPVQLKRGPKPNFLKKLSKPTGPWKKKF